MISRAFITCLLLLLRLCNADSVGSNVESRELGLADIPPCGIQCMFLTIPASGCSLDDLNCVCNNAGLAQTLAGCMLANCTMSDTLGTARVQSDICNLPRQSKRKELFLYTGIIYFAAILLVALRIGGKLISNHISLDDWIVVAALLLLALPVGCVLAMTDIGFGQHLWSLGDGELLRILRFFYISSAFYVLVLGMIKVSLVFFYLEIFRTPRFKVSAYLILAYIVVNSFVIFFLTLFSCIPIAAFWDRDTKGKCMNVQALAYANSASAIVQDIILLILPVMFIHNLQMKKYRKIAVGLMFAIGTFGCIATIIRLRTLLAFKISIDPTWDYVPVTIWTELELLVGFICVSLPSIRILVVRILPTQVKEFLSHITHISRSRSSKGSRPEQQREWNKPVSWINVTAGPNDSSRSSDGKKNLNSLWSPRSRAGSSRRDMRNGSRQLESGLSNYSESGVAVTRPPLQEERSNRKFEQVEMRNVAKPSRSARQSLMSCGSRDSRITALPTIGKIGCLPEGSFSDLNVAKKSKSSDRKWGSQGYVRR